MRLGQRQVVVVWWTARNPSPRPETTERWAVATAADGPQKPRWTLQGSPLQAQGRVDKIHANTKNIWMSRLGRLTLVHPPLITKAVTSLSATKAGVPALSPIRLPPAPEGGREDDEIHGRQHSPSAPSLSFFPGLSLCASSLSSWVSCFSFL